MSEHAADDTVPEVDESRRKFLIAATATTGAVGAVLTAVPFLASWKPSESARAAGLPTQVDLTRLEPGQMATVFWRKKQIYVVRRTPEMLAMLGNHDAALKDAASEESTARISAVCRRRASRRAMPRCRLIGRAVSSAPAMDPSSISRAAYSRVHLPR
jgi:ubiquinol-cytochrome c reductase iron-sulfur subunit